ncbi:hypothetical protein F0P96_01370 [Hymenobacter busanensis]|uniref:Uncharacterized protein n=1 Tax=Hymenobacter busanensis TaxID=2607656 RepID=A0A7L4ZU53_9BACT|nr:hypothetical protein [Hymenobacter busanensis]KAA9339304.1 hypothetical protein F0P96_01370 [Hymenobacter busanensis]QHJ06934.1 hypothetical protein GUY19_06380 [Hymenobacter busanensis]
MASLLTAAVPALGQTKPAPKTRVAERAAAPAAVATPSFYATYRYRSYTIHSAGQEPVAATGVGGTLTLLPSGVYEKHLQLTGANGPMSFDQRGRFTLSGDNISFLYLSSQGDPKADNGTFRFDPKKQTLDITIEGFPAGSKGVYSLSAQPAPKATKP